MTLDEMQAEIGAWGDKTFPNSTVSSVAVHFEEEADEFLLAVRTSESVGEVVEEMADCFLLLLHFAHKNGFSLFDAAMEKMAVNRKRKWNTTPEPAGHFKHVEP